MNALKLQQPMSSPADILLLIEAPYQGRLQLCLPRTGQHSCASGRAYLVRLQPDAGGLLFAVANAAEHTQAVLRCRRTNAQAYERLRV